MTNGARGKTAAETAWHVYLVRAGGGTLYTGIATDVDRRLEEHRSGTGARYLRGRGPLEVVYRRKLGDRGLALRVEHAIKRLPRAEKEEVVEASPTKARLLKRLGLPRA